NPPRLFELRQLIAMFRAFEIPWDPPSFIMGKFIRPNQTRHDALLAKLAMEMSKGESRRIDRRKLPAFFKILLEYRQRVDDVLSFSSGLIEASGLYLHAHRKAGELNRIVHDNVGTIDDTLVAIISPAATVFAIEILVRNHGYPVADEFDDDMDWF